MVVSAATSLGRWTEARARSEAGSVAPILSPYAMLARVLSSPVELWYTCAMGLPSRLWAPRGETASAGRTVRFFPWILILVALGLRLTRLNFQPLWWDEGWSLYFATTDLGSMLRLTAVDIHPPFYYLLLHFWIQILGSSALAVRLFSVLVGTATVLLLYFTGRRLLGEMGGLLAALLLAISPLHIYYSQEVRMYGLVTLFGLGALYFALELENQRWRIGSWLAYVLLALAALYTGYYAAFLLLGLNLFVLARWWRQRRPIRDLIPWLVAQLVVVALFLPWLWYSGAKLLAYVRYKVGVEQDIRMGLLPYLGRHLAAFSWGHAEGSLADYWWLGLLPLAILVLIFALLLRRHGARSAGWPWLGLAGLCTLVLAGGYVINLLFPFNPPRGERLLLLALPVYLLAVAAALRALWQVRRPLALLPLVFFVIAPSVSLWFFYVTPRYPDDDYRPLAARVSSLALPTDAILNVHPWQVGYFQAYIPDDDARPELVLTPRQVLPRERQLWADDPALMAADLDALLEQNERLWLPDHQTMARFLESQIETYLSDRAYPVMSEWYGENTVLSLFANGAPAKHPVEAQFGDWLVLDGAALNSEPLESGWGILTVDLTWRLLERPDERYHVGLRLTDAAGRTWAQRDSNPGGGLQHFFEWPVGEPQTDRHGLLVPPGTPPGEYRVTLRVYRSRDVAVLPVVFEGGSGGEVTLAALRIVRPDTPPPPEALALDRSLQADFGNRLRLLGSELRSDSTLRTGEVIEVDLFWQVLAEPGEDFLPRIQLLDLDGVVVAKKTDKPVAGTYPTAWWQEGELVRDPHTLSVPAMVPAGRYLLAASLIRAADGEPLETKGGETLVRLAEIDIQGREHRFDPTEPLFEQGEILGESVELTGYDMREAVRAPGSPLEVTLHWRAIQTPDKNYHTFVHLVDEEASDARIIAQHDGPPGEGQLPTMGWLPGEYLTDTHLLQLPFDLPDGEYRLTVGLYDPETAVRLGQSILLDRPVPVEARGGCNCR